MHRVFVSIHDKNYQYLRIFFTILLLSVMPSISMYGQVIMQHPHEEIKNGADTIGFKKVFLAGTIDMGNSVNWQKNLATYLESRGGKWLLFNPRQDSWNGEKKGEMDYQVNWELSHLEQSDFIIMNILETSKSPISLLELGLFARSGKMAVACDTKFYRYNNVKITCQKYGVHLYPNLEALLRSEFK